MIFLESLQVPKINRSKDSFKFLFLFCQSDFSSPLDFYQFKEYIPLRRTLKNFYFKVWADFRQG